MIKIMKDVLIWGISWMVWKWNWIYS